MRNLLFVLFWLGLPCAGCSSGEACVEVTADCAALYQPDFEQIHARTLLPSCAINGASCHAPEGGQGGLRFGTADEAHSALLGGSEPRVIPGDPGCSPLVTRLHSTDPGEQMPPGSPLSAEERCVFVQWVSEGAAR